MRQTVSKTRASCGTAWSTCLVRGAGGKYREYPPGVFSSAFGALYFTVIVGYAAEGFKFLATAITFILINRHIALPPDKWLAFL
jgi:hypothetical protein